MALVSSIRSAAITNDFNEGANCLKNYLRYAEAASIGDSESASRILQTLSQPRAAEPVELPGDAVVEQLGRALKQRGYRVDLGVGQSHFRCDLAISRPDDDRYRLGILVDTADWYSQRDLVERELLKPELLAKFGWRIHVVLARDWYGDSAAVLEAIERLLAGEELDEQDDEPEVSPGDPTPAPASEAGNEIARFDEPNGSDSRDTSETASNPVPSDGAPSPAASDGRTWSDYLEFVGGGSSKFWEISVRGPEQTIRFGRIGSPGQTLSKSFNDHDSALGDAKRQSEGKRGKGYVPK
jgi:predicted DNA-binding WGR domain protein